MALCGRLFSVVNWEWTGRPSSAQAELLARFHSRGSAAFREMWVCQSCIPLAIQLPTRPARILFFFVKGHEPELVCSTTIKARYCSKRQSPVSAGHNDPRCPIWNCCPFREKVTATTSTQMPPLLSDCKVRCRLPSSRCTLNHSRPQALAHTFKNTNTKQEFALVLNES